MTNVLVAFMVSPALVMENAPVNPRGVVAFDVGAIEAAKIQDPALVLRERRDFNGPGGQQAARGIGPGVVRIEGATVAVGAIGMADEIPRASAQVGGAASRDG